MYDPTSPGLILAIVGGMIAALVLLAVITSLISVMLRSKDDNFMSIFYKIAYSDGYEAAVEDRREEESRLSDKSRTLRQHSYELGYPVD